MLPSDTPISGYALALSASSFRPVTADHNVPGFAWNGGLCIMPGTRKNLTFLERGFDLTLEGCFGTSPRLTLAATRFVVPYLEPIFIGLGRAVVAAFFAGALLIFSRQSKPSKKQLYQLVVVALGVVIGFPVLSAWAI
jgi:hypothetical protein